MVPADPAPVVPWLASRIVGIASLMIPAALRSEWKREWCAELWHLDHELQMRDPSAWARVALVRRSLGAIFDALQLRLGDAQLWRECMSCVVHRWERHPTSVAFALLFLSLGIGTDSLLIASGRIMIGAPRSPWASLVTETRLLILLIAVVCGVALIVASAAAAARLLEIDDRSGDRRHVLVIETVLVAAITVCVARWFADFRIRAELPGYPTDWGFSGDLGAVMSAACVESWLCGLAVLTGLRMRRHRLTPSSSG